MTDFPVIQSLQIPFVIPQSLPVAQTLLLSSRCIHPAVCRTLASERPQISQAQSYSPISCPKLPLTYHLPTTTTTQGPFLQSQRLLLLILFELSLQIFLYIYVHILYIYVNNFKK